MQRSRLDGEEYALDDQEDSVGPQTFGRSRTQVIHESAVPSTGTCAPNLRKVGAQIERGQHH